MKETYSQELAEFSLFQIASTKDVNVMMAEIRATLADANRDWDRRVSSVRLKTFFCFSVVFSSYQRRSAPLERKSGHSFSPIGELLPPSLAP